mmetsp:Transcript_6510/g.7966  ORF Transcript_6510/g.7966 Transcript_6510/m.7966 type:complete len:226 (+) Transcript_6510:48-725(+)
MLGVIKYFLESLILLALNSIFYTSYSKQKKTIDLALLGDVFLCRVSMDHTLVELNKVFSLVGVSMFILGMLALACWKQQTGLRFLVQAVAFLWIHSLYSLVRFYGTSHIPRISTFPKMFSEMFKKAKSKVVAAKKVSIILGSLAQMITIFWILEGKDGFYRYFKLPLSFFGSGMLVATLGIGHFYLMEIDYKGRLAVRPFGMLPFILFPILLLVATMTTVVPFST